jgi:hypothetical protein
MNRQWNIALQINMTSIEAKEYSEFRTGLTFSEVFWLLRSGSDDPRDWPKGITRHTVLGKWHQIKLEMWSEYKHMFQIEYE